MAQLDFGLLNTNAPAQIAGAYDRGQQEAQANQLAQLQMRQQTASTQGAEMNLARVQKEHAALDKLMTDITANGGPSDPMQAADMMMKSGHPDWFAKGLLMKQSYAQLNSDRVAMGLPPLSAAAAPAPAAAPAAAPAPAMQYPQAAAPATGLGSGMFGMGAPTNAMAPAAPVNTLAAQTQAPVGPDKNALMMQAKAKMLSPTAGVREAGKLEMQHLLGAAEPVDAIMMQKIGYPLTPAGYQAYRDAQRQERMLSPTEEAQRIRIALASRPPAPPIQPVAPTITQIVDPTNPNQMITVDARRYQGGGVGTPGVLGVGGKEPGAALRTNKAEAGKTQLADDLDNLRSSFQKLDALRAIPSTERGALSNVTSALASTRAGQLTGQAFATEAQVERDVINSARSRLVNAIKNATGMSAQQLNSNVELQTMLRSISDPGQSYQSATRIIDDIEKAYVIGNGQLPKSGRAAPAAATGKWEIVK